MRYREAKSYLDICKRAFDTTGRGGKVRLFWNGDALDAQGWRDEFLRALHRRISGPDAANHRGKPKRKLAELYQTGLIRDRRKIDDYVRFRAVHPCRRLDTPELQSRFAWEYSPDEGLSIRLQKAA